MIYSWWGLARFVTRPARSGEWGRWHGFVCPTFYMRCSMSWESVGPVPAEERCQQVGIENYNADLALQECQVYMRQLMRMFPFAKFKVKSNPHDFGTYLEVNVWYDKHGSEAEWNLPANWDDRAKFELERVALGTRFHN